MRREHVHERGAVTFRRLDSRTRAPEARSGEQRARTIVTALTISPATLPQVICMLALSRGVEPFFPPITRRELLRKRWITPGARIDKGKKRKHEITDAGRRALATSPHLAEAQRKLYAGKQGKPWQ